MRRNISFSRVEQQRKGKDRSRNACERCKQKKVKCDSEGVGVCAVCREGDFRCNYAQKPPDEKRQYRKGYVEMVEETNNYYKKGLHKIYKKFRDEEIFRLLRLKNGGSEEPTVQEIISALGETSTDIPREGGIGCISSYLERQSKPKLVRRGEWDVEEIYPSQQQLSPSTSEEMETEIEPTTDASSSCPTYSRTSPFNREFDTAFADLPPSPYLPAIQLIHNDPFSVHGGIFASSQGHHPDLWSQLSGLENSSRFVPVLPLTPPTHSSQQQRQRRQPPGDLVDFEHLYSHVKPGSPCTDQSYGKKKMANQSCSTKTQVQDFGHGEDDATGFFIPQAQAGFPTICLEVLEYSALAWGRTSMI